MKNALAVLLGLTLVAAAPATGAEPQFRYRREIDRGKHDGETILAVPLDSAVYTATRAGFPDVRVRDRAGRDVPYVLEQAGARRPASHREVCASETVSLHERDNNAIEILVRLAEKAPNATGLTLDTPLSDYEHRVVVFGSTDGTEWTRLVSDGLIFDYHRFMDIHNRDVTFPVNTFRRFKVVIEQVEDEQESPYRVLTTTKVKNRERRESQTSVLARRPFRIDKVEMWRTVETEGEIRPQKSAYSVESLEVRDDPKKKRTRITVRTGREPLTRFELVVGRGSFSRTASVRIPERRGVETTWVEVGRGTIYRIQFHDFKREHLRIDFPEQRADEYEIDIENEDSPPLDIRNVTAEGNVYRLVFLGLPERRYRLDYGSETAKQPRYDAESVLASLRPQFQPASVRLGTPRENRGYRPDRGLRAFLNRQVVLILAVALMVLVLLWALVQAGKHVSHLPNDDEVGEKRTV